MVSVSVIPCLRSIPACAGEPRGDHPTWTMRQVYPRVCGGTRVAGRSTPEQVGLSPRVRGNLAGVYEAGSSSRSIPACAGEPFFYVMQLIRSKVYPRVCGGTPLSSTDAPCGQGLSPRVRGNLFAIVLVAIVWGSIPACAGEPTTWRTIREGSWVYPRVCGGTEALAVLRPFYGGLSPRVRGNPIMITCRPADVRSIPACAGEPHTPWLKPIPHRVYPRVCGGTEGKPPGSTDSAGLSPRVRGNRDVGWFSGDSGGSIPACAGEP